MRIPNGAPRKPREKFCSGYFSQCPAGGEQYATDPWICMFPLKVQTDGDCIVNGQSATQQDNGKQR